MSYLKRFCVDALKIDRSFVNGVATDTHDAAMVKSMITLAHELNLRVVAEGIETEAQLSFLNQLSCDEGQGYLFAKPQAAAVVRDILFSPRSKTQVTPAFQRAPTTAVPNRSKAIL
jgi:EAL domain-containing protein (putative c-di-GMP-specific phosphodiesterase class I)